MKKLKIAVGMSGGVDSSLAAVVLKEEGYEVTGVFMDCWEEPGCKTDPNRKDALKVGLELGIKMKVVDFKQVYREKVIDWFYEELRKGRTPNPDVVCNREIKFGLFLDWARKEGFDRVATGHYARLEKDREGRRKLLRGVDEKKDQSYFLSMLSQKQLRGVMFPVGGMLKREVRQEAKKRRLEVWDKKDSTGICFIGEMDFKEFLKKEIKVHKGEVVNMEGKVIGEHEGIEFYTIGQRHGFKIRQSSSKSPALYVIRKEAERNRLVVGSAKAGERQELEIEDLSLIRVKQLPKTGLRCRIRHQGRLIGCRVEEWGKGRMKVRLEKKERGISPGQIAVFYRGEECLGGGVIKG